MSESNQKRPERLPLFPLDVVLFPGSSLSLRVFELRYLDMVRDCIRDEAPFGINLNVSNLQGSARPGEEDHAAGVARYGCSATITDWSMGDDGLFNITVKGQARYEVSQVSVRDNGLIVGTVRWHEPSSDPSRPQPVPAQYGVLASVLSKLFEQLPDTSFDAADLDDAHWVSFRLAELLPIHNAQRQLLLELDSANDRLERLTALLAQLQDESG